MLGLGKGKTPRASLWAYTLTQFGELRAVVYDFIGRRAGGHARVFPADCQGNLVCDDYSRYKAAYQQGITEIGYGAHASNFFDPHANRSSQIVGRALPCFATHYDIERDAAVLIAKERRELRQRRAKPV